MGPGIETHCKGEQVDSVQILHEVYSQQKESNEESS